jgi:hypothetical protein
MHSSSVNDSRLALARDILQGVIQLVTEAHQSTQPLEVEPQRSRLFEYFVTADGGGLIADDRDANVAVDENDDADELDLSADGLCRLLAQHWGLDMAARESAATQTRLATEQLEQMRLLWSVMRMWMEWSYAWNRWAEFHDPEPVD